jgi:hypothetical protein
VVSSPRWSSFLNLAQSPAETGRLCNPALQGIQQVVAEVVVDLLANRDPVPEPPAAKKYNGRFMVGVPSELHRRLAPEELILSKEKKTMRDAKQYIQKRAEREEVLSPKTLGHLVPVDRIPPSSNMFSPAILIFEVIGMFPNIQYGKWYIPIRERVILIGG